MKLEDKLYEILFGKMTKEERKFALQKLGVFVFGRKQMLVDNRIKFRGMHRKERDKDIKKRLSMVV
jgi:hypothetical protein